MEADVNTELIPLRMHVTNPEYSDAHECLTDYSGCMTRDEEGGNAGQQYKTGEYKADTSFHGSSAKPVAPRKRQEDSDYDAKNHRDVGAGYRAGGFESFDLQCGHLEKTFTTWAVAAVFPQLLNQGTGRHQYSHVEILA